MSRTLAVAVALGKPPGGLLSPRANFPTSDWIYLRRVAYLTELPSATNCETWQAPKPTLFANSELPCPSRRSKRSFSLRFHNLQRFRFRCEKNVTSAVCLLRNKICNLINERLMNGVRISVIIEWWMRQATKIINHLIVIVSLIISVDNMAYILSRLCVYYLRYLTILSACQFEKFESLFESRLKVSSSVLFLSRCHNLSICNSTKMDLTSDRNFEIRRFDYNQSYIKNMSENCKLQEIIPNSTIQRTSVNILSSYIEYPART